MAFRKSISLLIVGLAVACDDPKPTTGTVVLSVEGLPAGANAAIRVTGPNEFAKTVLSTETLEKLAPGDYTLRVSGVLHQSSLYTSTVATQVVSVTPGATETLAVPYELASGSVDLSISGLPPDANANISLRRADGFNRAVLSPGLQAGLPAGTYTLRADTTTTPLGDVFGPAEPSQQSLTISPSVTPVPAAVSYNQTTGILELTVSGLPAGLSFLPVTVTGPGGFRDSTRQSRSFHGLTPGSYSISAATASASCPTMYTPSTALQTVEVTTSGNTAANVAYSEGQADPADLNLRIAHAQVIQVTQDSAGAVPIIANRPALLRLYGLASQCNDAMPSIRVTFSNGAVVNAPAQEASVRMMLSEGTLLSTWNVNIPGESVQPGLSFNAVIDPTNAIAESQEGDNRYPPSGDIVLDVVRIAPVRLRIMPIAQPANGIGNITSDNLEQFLAFSRKVHPVDSFAVVLASTFTTQTNIAGGTDGNGWVSILSQLDAARQADASANGFSRFHHGILQIPFSGPVIAGIAFVGGWSGLSWDRLPGASAVVAHELGHNFGQQHAPCGGPPGVDINYPYNGGKIGKYGYDAATQTLKAPQAHTDVMGYCPGSEWISDYMYKRMRTNLANRQTSAIVAGAAVSERLLLVWGRIVNGEPVLEPAFEIDGRAQLPAPGPHRLAALTRDGSEAFNISFAGNVIADLPGNNETFAFTVPVSMLRGRPIESLRLTARGRTVRNRMSIEIAAGVAPDPQLRVTRAGSRAARVRWDATRYPVVMVRDPATGDVLSFARGGDATIVTEQNELELNVSNRVQSAKVRRAIQ